MLFYVDNIIKSDTTLQQRFHCLEAMLGTNKVSVYSDIPTAPLKSAFKKTFLILRYEN